MLIQIIPLHNIQVHLKDILHQLLKRFIFAPHRSNQDEFNTIESLEHVELILFCSEVVKLGFFIRVYLFYQGHQTFGETFTVLNPMTLL